MNAGSKVHRGQVLSPEVLQVHPRGDVVSAAEIAHRFATREYTCEADFVLPRPVPPAHLVPDGYVHVRDKRTSSYVEAVYELPGEVTTVITTTGAQTRVTIAGTTASAVDRAWNETRSRAASSISSGDLALTFWSNSSHGAARREHVREPVAWQQIRSNYSARGRQQLDDLMSLTSANRAGGHLLLWHGPTGTGKTTAVTALLSAWRSWCDGHLVTDPEHFFAAPDYVMEVADVQGKDRLDQSLPTLTAEPAPRWKLIVCEDADEYLRSDARQRSGPALGRLLNLTDGLIGRGSDTLVLLTTNDDLGRLHPAVTRPGRCLAAVEFPNLTPDEAREWCHGQMPLPQRPLSLAELYALRDGRSLSHHSTDTGLFL